MKKTLIVAIFLSVVAGGLFGNFLYEKYVESIPTFKDENTYYFLQEGAYSSEENMNRNTKDLRPKLIIKEDELYYVYVGITKNEENALKIKELYEKEGYTLYLKEKSIDNSEFKNNLEQFDLLLESSKTFDEVNAISEVIISSYEEMTQKG